MTTVTRGKERKFACQACGTSAPTWSGRCSACGGWNTIIEEVAREDRRPKLRAISRDEPSAEEEKSSRPEKRTETRSVPASEVEEEDIERVASGIKELDHVLGGGIVQGGAVLLSGEPGSGKSTILLQAMASLARGRERTLYVSGEESLGQIGARAKRLGVAEDELFLCSTKELDEIFGEIEKTEPFAVVVDSIQAIRSPELDSPAGTVSQLKEITSQLIDVCKDLGIALFLIGHITKDGAIAGPKIIEHLVDTVLTFEGDDTHALRILRGGKNRFGKEKEIGVFEMTSDGMREVPSPSAMLLAERREDAPGSCVVATCEGSRSMLVEVQALVAPKGAGRRMFTGIDPSRINMVLAVLRDHVPGACDVFVNVTGGARVTEPGIDLGVAIALMSAMTGLVVQEDVACFGEIGLSGEVRGSGRAETRISEAVTLGFRKIIVPWSTGVMIERGRGKKNVELVKVKTVREAVAQALGCSVSSLKLDKKGR